MSTEKFKPGDRVACYVVLGELPDPERPWLKHYLTRADCCGTEYRRSQGTLIDYTRRQPKQCRACMNPVPVAIGQRFGPVVVLGPSAGRDRYQVQWDCCLGVDEYPRKYLVELRRRADLLAIHQAIPDPDDLLPPEGPIVCRRCVVEKARLAQARMREIRKAMKAMGVLAKAKLRDEPKVELRKGTAKFEPGVISAAVAWPRPGARS